MTKSGENRLSGYWALGCFKEPYHIQLKDDAIPVREPPRRVRVPFGLRDRLKTKLNKLEEQNVITKMDKPTDWVSNLVIVEKKDGTLLRLCLDSRELNKAIKREHFQLSKMEEVTS